VLLTKNSVVFKYWFIQLGRLMAISLGKLMYLATLLVFVIGCFGSVSAQDRLEFGGFLGTSYYFGDLNPAVQFKDPGLAFGGIGRYVFNDRVAFKAMAVMGKISGSYDPSEGSYLEDVTMNPGYSFSRNVGDISGQFELNFLSYDHRFISNTVFTPYLSFGLATSIYSVSGRDNQNGDAKPVFVLSLPFGFGAKYKLNKWMRVGAEWTFRKTFADDLDYASVGYVDPADPYGYNVSTMTHNNDWYSFAGVYLTINMFKRKDTCSSGY